MKLLYPSDPFNMGEPDENYSHEYVAAVELGFTVALFSFEEFQMGSLKVRPKFNEGEVVCYRGWMMTPEEYAELERLIRRAGAAMMTDPAAYKTCHYLPEWYPLLADYTPQTLFLSESDNVAEAVRAKGWDGCFLKDYVKSLSTDGGSLVRDLKAIPDVIAKMKKYRGTIEGGVCVREIEDFVLETEARHFVVRGVPHSLDATPEAVSVAAKVIGSPFFTVDTVQRSDGEVRIVELGDGQVSDRKDWTPKKLMGVLASL